MKLIEAIMPTGIGEERIKGRNPLYALQNISGDNIMLSNISNSKKVKWYPNDKFVVVDKEKGYGDIVTYTGYLSGKKAYPKSTFRIKATQIKGQTKRVKL